MNARLLVVGFALFLLGCAGSRRTADPVTETDPFDHLPAAEAIVAVERQMTLEPGEAYWPFRLGELHASLGDRERAEEALREALFIDPYHAPALSLVAKLYFETGNHDEAIARLELARSTPGAFPGGFPDELAAGLAVHYDAIGEIERADSLIRPLVVRSGPSESVVSAVTYVTLRGDGYETASKLAEQALAVDPKSAANLNNFGITRLQAGDPEEARRAFLRANRIDPDLPGPHYNLAIVEKYYFLDDQAAERWFSRYWTLSRDDPDGLAAIFLGEGETR